MEKQKNIPVLRFSEYTDEWELKNLGVITKQMQSGVSRKLNDTDIGLPILRSNNIQNEKLDVADIKYWYLIDDQGVNLENYYLKNGDILVNFINSLAQIGKVALFENLLKRDTIFTTNLLRVSLKNDVNTGFVFYNFNLKKYKDYIQSITKPAVNQASFTTKEFRNYQLALPSLPEQTKIAIFLTSVDNRLNQLKKKKSLLEQYKKGVMQKIFNQEIRFKDEEGKDFPEWVGKKFGSLYSFKATNTFSRDNLNYESGEVKNIHYGDIHTKFKPLLDTANECIPYVNNEMDISKIPSENYCKEGDLVIADASEDYNDIGKAIEVYNLNNEKVVAGLHTILAKPDLSKIALGFGAYLMKAEYIHFQIRVISQGTKVLGLSSNRLAEISVKLPCINEQTKIANFLSAIDEKISLSNTQIAKTEKYKKGLLQQMFV